jgi:hypothetical protein
LLEVYNIAISFVYVRDNSSASGSHVSQSLKWIQVDKHHPVRRISQPVLAGRSRTLSYVSGLVKHHWSKIGKPLVD